MPTVARFKGGRFAVNPNDHNPPHVHVFLDDGESCRIELLSGEFMDSPPRGMERTIRRAYFGILRRFGVNGRGFIQAIPEEMVIYVTGC